MFFILSKILHFLLVPFYWLHGTLLASLFVSPKKKRVLLISSICILYVYTTEIILNPLLLWWESPLVWYKDVEEGYDAAIVLGGMASSGKLPDDRTHFAGSSDRLMHAMQLYKLGKAKKIILSGGSGDIFGKKIPEAEYLKKVLLLCGVKEEDILYEDKSRNTRENATNTAILAEKYFAPGAKFLLVTSAWHMPRAVACYEKVGLKVKAFPVDSQAKGAIISPDYFFPGVLAPCKWYIILHELMGYVVYKVSGYI